MSNQRFYEILSQFGKASNLLKKVVGTRFEHCAPGASRRYGNQLAIKAVVRVKYLYSIYIGYETNI